MILNNEVPDQTRQLAIIPGRSQAVLVLDALEGATAGQRANGHGQAGPQNWADDPNRQWLHTLAVGAFRKGNAMIWITCACAERIVGTYAPGATRALAGDINRSVDTVEDMAHAAEVYHRLERQFRGASELRYLLPKLREVRRKLYYTHFSTMWGIWRKKPSMSALAVFGELETASADGTSTRGLGANGGGGEGAEAYLILPVWQVHGEEAKRILDYMVAPETYPDTFIVLLQGAEWTQVGSVKVKPA